METWIQSISVIATVIGSTYYIHKEIQSDMRQKTARTDRLYEMFIDLLKEGKK